MLANQKELIALFTELFDQRYTVLFDQRYGIKPLRDHEETLAKEVSVGASPYVWKNESAYAITVLVASGKVNSIAISKDGVNFHGTGVTAGQFFLAAGDSICVAHEAPPSMTVFPL